MKALVGIDLGTTGARVVAYDLSGRVIASGRSVIRRQTTEDWIGALVEATPSERLGCLKPEEKMVTVDSTSGTAVLVDERGTPVFPPMMYYERAAREFAELRRCGSSRELEGRGVRVSPTSPLPKIMRAMRSDPDAFGRVRWILPATTWLLYRLRYDEADRWEGVETDWTNALKFGEDITAARPRWFAPIFEDAGIPLRLLPSISPCGTFIGLARGRLARRLGLEGARLYNGMTDGNASALAAGCLTLGNFSIGCGTTTVPKFVCGDLKPHPAIYYHKHPIEGYLAGAAPVTGGMLDWVADKVFGISTREAFSLAEEAEAGQEHPYFPQGDRSPFDDPRLGAALLGLWPEDRPRGEVRGRIFRSMLLGIAFLEYFYIRLFEELFGVEIPIVNITGGGTRSRLWNTIRASVYERPVRIMEGRVTMGALIPVALKLGVFKDPDEVLRTLLRVTETVSPDRGLSERYRRLRDTFYDRWRALRRVVGAA